MRRVSKSGSSSPPSFTSPRDTGQTAKEVLKTTLKLAEKALDGLPIPSANGVLGTLLELIAGLEVSYHHI